MTPSPLQLLILLTTVVVVVSAHNIGRPHTHAGGRSLSTQIGSIRGRKVLGPSHLRRAPLRPRALPKAGSARTLRRPARRNLRKRPVPRRQRRPQRPRPRGPPVHRRDFRLQSGSVSPVVSQKLSDENNDGFEFLSSLRAEEMPGFTKFTLNDVISGRASVEEAQERNDVVVDSQEEEEENLKESKEETKKKNNVKKAHDLKKSYGVKKNEQKSKQ